MFSVIRPCRIYRLQATRSSPLIHRPYSTRRPNPHLAGIWEQYRGEKYDTQVVKSCLCRLSLDSPKKLPNVLGKGYENIAAPAMDMKSEALIKTIGMGRTAKELIIELEGRGAGVRTATDGLASFSLCGEHPTVSEAVRSMAAHIQWNVKPAQYPTTTLTSLLASSSIARFDPLDLDEERIRGDGRSQALAGESTRQTLPPRSGECCECQAFIPCITLFHVAHTYIPSFQVYKRH